MAGYILLLLLALYATSSKARVFVSIDCGASGNYTDQNSIEWIGDDALVRYGEPMQVQNQFMYGNSNALTTLRVFPARRKNCYSIGAEHGVQKGERILLRASFLYGNYDGKSFPPTFALQFDGNYWATIRADNFSAIVEEVIYVTKGDTLSVCIAKTHHNQLPFISSIEIRSMELHMYSNIDMNYALLGLNRIAYGVKNTIRYPADGYDRIWNPELVLHPQIQVTNDASSINVNIQDNPPLALFQSAMTVPTSDMSMDLTYDFFGLPFSEIPIYFNMYFSEVTQLSHSKIRAFDFFINEEAQSIYPIIPPYGSVIELTVPNATASFFSSFSLNATYGSTLPPLINGLELFTISSLLTDGTNSRDVKGVASLQKAFSILQEWTGDPCLPFSFMWEWVNCSFTAIPRVTALYLSNYSLLGSLPDISSMDALQIIDLRNNSLTGPIPEFLGTLPNLKRLNLEDNNFSGPIPASLINSKNLQLLISGNPGLCVDGVPCYGTAEVPAPSPGNSMNEKLPAIFGATVVSCIVLLGIVIVAAILQRRRAKAKSLPGLLGTGKKSFRGVPMSCLYQADRQMKDLIESHQSLQNDSDEISVPYFDMDCISFATENFSDANKLGKGGFGPVFKGNFPGGREMAVKRLSNSSVQGLEEFKNEVLLIAKLQHRNLVRLLGYCVEEDEKILLYEYMPNRSLDVFIFGSMRHVSLNWEIRFNIIMGIARGMLYLHQDSRLRIIHRDLKTSNILLDEDMNPKISDFGLARIFGGQQTEWTTKTVIGTCGYMSPEYALDGIFSVKSDVFSFGVVLLEIISGKRNTGYYQTEQTLSLLGYAWKLWSEGHTSELMDQTLHGACNVNEFFRCVNVGLLCVELDPCDRPNMSDVVLMLGSESADLPCPQKPAFTLSKSLADLNSSSVKSSRV